ncbi:HNH endonuclease [Actinomadura sp. 6K520]|uniref:HNH endonuclease n=1 Tax=Actinomadura sp. 6K520 TaxID=2530364 RepID=UPI00104470EA|nr:HNH endonuclease [Actinomadura sp. 6K520]TDE33594.1 HNH endonuclease [Actinomadura sp. 6K520]
MNVLVLNASYEPLQRVDLRHAIRMLVREVAVVEEAVEGRTFGSFPVPRVLRLVRYVAMRWRHGRRPPWSKRGVYLRDRGRCCYCGGRGNTIDHVHPRSRGGGDTWENTVLACGRCNNRKGDRTVAEAGLRLLSRPRVPRWEELTAP